MEHGYKMRIYPTKEQAIFINKTLGCSRFVYNQGLALRKSNYENKLPANYGVTSARLTEMKAEKDTAFLKEVDSIALQQSLRDLDAAYKKFFLGKSKYPRFKSKHDHRQSYRTINQGNNIRFDGNRINLPKMGWVKVKKSYKVIGYIHSATVSRTPSGNYYVSVLADFVPKKLDNTSNKVGIDVGIKEFAILSNGTKIENPKYLEQLESKLHREQRKLSKMQKGSNNWNKQRIKVARLHEHIVNKRRDFLQKLTTTLVRENQTICVENLNISGMLRNHHLAKAISSVSWQEFFRELEYKCNWYGRTMVKIPTFCPSSQTCHVCGYKHPYVKNLNVRDWQCPNCGFQHDRDLNAAMNILNVGLEQLA